MDTTNAGVKEMKPNEAECIRCGTVMGKYWMNPIGTGRNIHYICPKCFVISGRQADRFTMKIVDGIKRKENR